MRLFYKKHLAFLCFLLICGALMGTFAPMIVKKVFIAILAFSLISFLIISIVKKSFNFFNNFVLPIVFAVFGLLYFTLFSENINAKIERFTSEVPTEIEATILNCSYYSNYLTSFDIRTHKIGEKNVNFKMHFVADRALDAVVGEKIRARVVLSDFENDGSFDEKHYYNSQGFYFVATEDGWNTSAIGKTKSFELFFINLNNKLCDRFDRALNDDASGLINAIFLGNRDDIANDVKRDFKRTGTYHLLALSGMHLSVLSYMLDRFLRTFRAKKGVRFILVSIAIVFYVALTGFGLSVLRSSIMVLATFAAYFLRARSDSFTNLCIAASFIILFSPASVSDIGFWMSVLATFGIIVTIPIETFIRLKIRRVLSKKWLKPLKSIVSGLIFSFAAILFTLPFSAFSFKAISLVGPIVTLLVSPFVSILLSLAPFLLLLTEIPFVSGVFAFSIEALTYVVTEVSSYFSNLENVYMSLNYPFVVFLVIPFFIVLAVLLVINLKHKFVIPLYVALFTIIFIILELLSVNSKLTYTEYFRYKENEYFSISFGGKNVLIDISDGSSSNLYNAATETTDIGNCEIEAMILTHLHKRHMSSLEKSSSRFMIRNIYIPSTLNDDEAFIASTIKAQMSAKGIDVITYDMGTDFSPLSGIQMNADRGYIKRSTHPVIMFNLTGRANLSYIGSSYFELGTQRSTGEIIVAGTHGPVCKKKFTLTADKNTKLVSLANEEIYSFASIAGETDALILKNTFMISNLSK